MSGVGMQVFCDEAGVPVTALPDADVSLHEQALDSQMRAFFRLTSFSHRSSLHRLPWLTLPSIAGENLTYASLAIL